MNLNIDPIPLTQKPNNVGTVVNRLKQARNIKTVDVEAIKAAVLAGHSITAGELVGRAEKDWKSQQLFIWDFDNDAKTLPHVTPNEVLAMFKRWKISPAFAYYSFSHKPEHNKFRVAAICDEVITDPAECKRMILGVMQQFPTAQEKNERGAIITKAQIDLSCDNLDRFFYGTNKGLIDEFTGSETFPKAAALALYSEPIEIQGDKELILPSPFVSPSVPSAVDLKEEYTKFPLLDYVLRTTNSKRTRKGKGDNVGLNPCPICGHKDDFFIDVKRNIFKCFSDSGLKGKGGNILTYLQHTQGLDRESARKVFKYDILGIDREKERRDFINTRKKPSTQDSEKTAKGVGIHTNVVPIRPDNNNTTQTEIQWGGAIYFNPFETPEKIRRYGQHDIGMGYLFADVYKNVSRFVPEAKAWYVYDGRVWKQDLGGVIVAEQAKILTDYMIDCRKYIHDDEQRNKWLAFAIARTSKRNIDNMLAMATSVYPVYIREFDKDPNLLNCQNYTLNLQTFTAHKHRPDDFLSKITNVDFDPKAKCDRWIKFVDEVMCGDKETAKFLQKALGYALTGDTFEDCFFILYGSTTRNGKGTTMETTLHLLGDYGRTAQPESIAQKQFKHSGGPSEDIARLKGARFVNMSEPEKGLRLNSALVKQMTGSDTMAARFLNQNSFEFKPEFKLFINTNHLPRVSDDSIFASGRVKLIPFERHFPENEQEKGLKAFFKQPESMSGILNWSIEGLKAMRQEGFAQPQAVKEAVDQYRQESDTVGLFVSECLTAVPNSNVPLQQVQATYENWCESYGYSPLNSRNLADDLRKKGLTIKKSTGNKAYIFNYGIMANDKDLPKEWRQQKV